MKEGIIIQIKEQIEFFVKIYYLHLFISFMSQNKIKRQKTDQLQYLIQKSINDFKTACSTFGVSMNYCHTLLSILPIPNQEILEKQIKSNLKLLAQDIHLMVRGECFSQKLDVLLAERQQILKQLRAQLIINRSKDINLTTSCQQIQNIRVYTLMILESLRQLKNKYSFRDLIYITEVVNKVCQDIDFLRYSPLRKHIEFSNGNDPLFLSPLKKFWNLYLVLQNHRRPIVKLFSVDNEYRQRLNNADKFVKDSLNLAIYKQKNQTGNESAFKYGLQKYYNRKDFKLYRSVQRDEEKKIESNKPKYFPAVQQNKKFRSRSLKSDTINKQKLASSLILDAINEAKVNEKKKLNELEQSIESKIYVKNLRRQERRIQPKQSNRYQKTTKTFKTSQQQINQNEEKSYEQIQVPNRTQKIVHQEKKRLNDKIQDISESEVESPSKKQFYMKKIRQRAMRMQTGNIVRQNIHEQIERAIQIQEYIDKRVQFQREKQRKIVQEEEQIKRNKQREIAHEKQKKILQQLEELKQKLNQQQIERQRERVRQKQKLLQKQRQRQKEIEVKIQKMKENQKIKELELMREQLKKREDERQKQKARQKQRQLMKQKQRELLLEKQIEKLKLKQKQRMDEKTKKQDNIENLEKQIERIKRRERQKLFQIQKQKERQAELQKQIQAKLLKQKQIEKKAQKNFIIYDSNISNLDKSIKKSNQLTPQNAIQRINQLQKGNISIDCSFKSKQILAEALNAMLLKLYPLQYNYFDTYINGVYFKNQHLVITSCIINEEIVSLAIMHPKITLQSRILFLLYFNVYNDKYQELQNSLLLAQIKHIFENDPCEKLVYLRHNRLFNARQIYAFKNSKNYVGQIKSPFTISQISEKSFLFLRKSTPCLKNEQFDYILNASSLFLTSKNDLQIMESTSKDIYFANAFMTKIQKKFLLKDEKLKKFNLPKELTDYLESQKLPVFKKTVFKDDQIILCQSLIEDCLTKATFTVINKCFYFTVEPPFVGYYENQDIYFIALQTANPKKFLILGDKLFETHRKINIFNLYQNIVEGKSYSQLFENEKMSGKMVSCPFFKRQIQTSLGDMSAIVSLQLNWRDYIKGVRYYSNDLVSVELIPPFFCGMASLNQEDKLILNFSTFIQQENILDD